MRIKTSKKIITNTQNSNITYANIPSNTFPISPTRRPIKINKVIYYQNFKKLIK
jgi:hypothetical protein